MFELKDQIYQQLQPNNGVKFNGQVCLTEQNFIQSLLPVISDAAIVTETSGRVCFLNAAAENLTGWKSKDAQSLSLTEVFPILHEIELIPLNIFVRGKLAEKYLDGKSNRAFLMLKDNRSFLIEYSIVPFYETERQLAGIILIFREANSSANNFQTIDFLTGLINRYSFEKYLEQTISSTKMLDEQHVLCYLDLDHFKIVNETCGYLAGDELLRQVSAILRQRVRKTDILARLTSDEFGLILYHCTLEQAISVLQILLQEIEKLEFVWEDNTFNLSMSIGVVVISKDSENSSRMLNTVNSACSAAKSNGRNRIYVSQPNDLAIVNKRGEIEWIPRIFKALQEDRFVLYYQPIISLIEPENQAGIISSRICEVLLRLEDADRKLIPPNQFIPIAEKYGLMHLIDRWVIRSLFEYLQSETPNNIIYSVNISGASLNDNQFLDFVEAQFDLFSIPPEMICFEITETLAISNLNQAIKFINYLRAMGCYFALDDFGSGMSSFGYLKKLPLNFLKIDGLFVKEMKCCNLASEIVEAINRIAHVMKIQTIAEHVETQDILNQLKLFHIDYAQGYCIAKPSPIRIA